MPTAQTATTRNAPTGDETISEIVEGLRSRFDAGVTQSLAWRIRQLEGIYRFATEREHDIAAALNADLGKPSLEAYGAEISYVANDAAHAKKHLEEWIKPERVASPLIVHPAKSEIRREPLGVVLIISPWNYPYQLLMAPLVAAVAAGNTALLKPSEIAPHTSALIAAELPRYVDAGCIRVVEGGIPETTEILAQRFDHIFYTGNGHVGRIVMRAAAEHLTPVTLELGGKSPAFVDSSADLDVAARRLMWGKFFNAGQTCVAPDYVLVDASVKDALLAKMKSVLQDFYGQDPKSTKDFARIINTKHHDRLTALLEGQTVFIGGEHDRENKYIAPTILVDVDPESAVMQEEIFGPILPVIGVANVDAALRFINGRDKPLALYVFSTHKPTVEKVLGGTSSGGASVNHVWLHLAVPDLPFGGVGESGMGAYHGRHGFETFSHRKAVLHKPNQIDPDLLYPPYTPFKSKWAKRLL